MIQVTEDTIAVETIHPLREGMIHPLAGDRHRLAVAEVLDGFKRLTAARALPGMRSLSARLLAADERAAKAAIYGLNRGSRPVQELEEAWVIHALVREDGMTQVEGAGLLGRDKDWGWRGDALGGGLGGGAPGEL